MQIYTLFKRFILIFLDIYLHVKCFSHFCDFDTVAFLIISTTVIHHMLTLISKANLQWSMVMLLCDIAVM